MPNDWSHKLLNGHNERWKSWDSISALFLRMSVIPNDSLLFALPTHVNQAIIWNDSLNTFDSPNQSLAKHLPLTRFSHINSFCHFLCYSACSLTTYQNSYAKPTHYPNSFVIHLNSLTTQHNSITHSITNQLTHSLFSSSKLKLPFATYWPTWTHKHPT